MYYVTTKPPKPKNWRCVGGGDGAHRKDFLNFVSKEDKVKSSMYMQSSAYRVLKQHGFLKNIVYFGTLVFPFSTK